jgi:transcription initiation factor TFIID subunit 8
MGHNFSDLMVYTKGMKHSILPPLQTQQPQKQLNMLPAGSKHPLPPYIPQHLPQFPDPHAYVRTPVSLHSHFVKILHCCFLDT